MTVMLDDLTKWMYANEREYSCYMGGSESYSEFIKLEKMCDTSRTSDTGALYLKREKSRFRIKEWRQRNPDMCRNHARNRCHLKRANGTGVYIRHWRVILLKYNHRCAYCGVTAEETEQGYLTQEHIIPVSKGGEHSPHNIVPACVSCNSSKWNRLDYKKPQIYTKKGVIAPSKVEIKRRNRVR